MLEVLAEPRAQVFSDAFSLLGQALWTAQAVERFTRTILVLCKVHAGLGGSETIDAFLAAGAATDRTWSQAQKDLEAFWPDDLVKPDGLQERITAIRQARNDLAHALPDPIFLALTGVPMDDDPLADLRQLIEDADTLLHELFTVVSALSGESTQMLMGVSGGVVMNLLAPILHGG